MRAIKGLGLVIAALLVLTAVGVAAMVGVRSLVTQHSVSEPSRVTADPDSGTAPVVPAVRQDPTDSPSGSPSPTGSPTGSPSPTEPAPLLAPGDADDDVRAVQHRLFQLDWLPEQISGTYDAATEEAVRGFQAKRGLPATGLVDQKTLTVLTEMTEEPTHDQMYNILRPGPALLSSGDSGDEVRAVQARLDQIGWWSGDVSGDYDAATIEQIKGFQTKRGIPVTGEVDQRTMDRLTAMTSTPSYEAMHNIEPTPGALAGDCLTGRVLCIDKTTQTLRWVVDGSVAKTFDVRFGSELTPTREGIFSVNSKSRDHVSSIYDTSMPFAMFFSGGQAVHYSSDFASVGYNGASHGCVNVRDYDGIAWLFDEVNVGDRVVVYRS